MASLLTFITDFGYSDGYAGSMTGAALRVAPQLRTESITHGIAPGDVAAGSYWLAATAGHFPQGTVHCCVVDPGVGTDRKVVVARVDHQLVVAPDNGLLHFLWRNGTERLAVHLEVSEATAASLSATFHGRDLFAPTAARLASGALRIEDLGPRIRSPRLLPQFLPEGDSSGTAARVVVIDHFGNAILSIARNRWYRPVPESVTLANGRTIASVVRTYAEVEDDFALLWNSADHLEIAARGISAATALDLHPGDQVHVAWSSAKQAALEAERGAVRA